ncbi:MAG TPA: hypothetical protein ENH05_08115 [Rhizobiales bacterium]|nr:hypothetical protein [Hyphomicrobiales bacterium]
MSAALWLDFSCSSGGIAYFAGPNLLFPIEPHVFWPFVHWLPRGLAVRLMRALGSRKVLDANSASWWRLHAWFDGFEVSNALPYFMHHALAQGRKGWRFKPLYAIPSRLLDRLSFASPGFVFILQRPYPPHHG